MSTNVIVNTCLSISETHASENLTTNLSVGISAAFATSLFVMALIIAEATSLRTFSFLHALGSQVTCTKGILLVLMMCGEGE